MLMVKSKQVNVLEPCISSIKSLIFGIGWIPILNCVIIKFSVVHYKSLSSVLFLNQKYLTGPGAFTGSTNSIFHHFFNLGVHFFSPLWGKRLNLLRTVWASPVFITWETKCVSGEFLGFSTKVPTNSLTVFVALQLGHHDVSY